MRLRRLRINRLPGIEPGFELDGIAPGVNLVTGPNAIGKSSLIRAIRYLVAAPSARDPLALSLDADFENDALLNASRNGTSLVWQQEGRVIDPPALPDAESLHCYWLTMENLAAGDDDRMLVEQLQQALAGGYNLRVLRDEVFLTQSRVGGAEGRELRRAEKKRQDVETGYQALRQKEDRLPELEADIEQARAARTRAEQRERALTLLDLLRRHREIEIALEGFPAQMPKLDGREKQRLDELEKKRAEKKTQKEAAKQAFAAAEQQLRDTGLAEARPESRELAAHGQRLQEVTRRQEERENLRVQREQAKADETRALEALGGNKPPQLTPENVSEAEQFARELQQTEKDCREIQARLEDAGDAPDEQRIQRHSQAVDHLNRWLASPKNSGLGQAIVTAVSTGLLVGILAGFAGIAPAAAGGVIALLAWAVSFFLARDTERPAQQKAFEALKVKAPSAWTEAAVAQQRDRLQQELAALHSARERATLVQAARDELRRKQAERKTLEERKQTLAEEWGFDPALTAAGLDRFVRLANDYQQAAAKRRELDQQISSVENRLAEARDAVQGFLKQWGYDVAADEADLAAALEELRQRSERAADAIRRRDEAEGESRRLDQELAGLQEDTESVYQNAGFSPEQRRELEEALERLPQWKEQQQALRDLNGQIRQQREALSGEDKLIELAEQGDRETLEADHERARRQSEQYETLVQEHSNLTAEVNRAGRDRDLEEAMAEVDAARAALEDRLDEQLFAEAGQCLLDEVEAEHRSEHEPEVLADARERFQTFTHYAFSLELKDEAFVARDLKRNEWRDLDELSSGTRMQLLLAVRLAWTRRLEKAREPLPIFLDEALTTSDENRFQAVAQSLNTLAKEEGRQVFYLSARRHELALWERLTGERPHHIDMAQVRFGQTETSAEDYAVTEPEKLPAPDGKKPDAYAAELKVPPVDPRDAADNIPLFYLVRDDLPLLHHLMQDWKIRTLGQLATLLKSDAGQRAIPDDDKRRRLAGRCLTARTWVTTWRRGRGKPVDRITLEASEAVSEKFIDAVTDLAHQVNGDAEQLLEGLTNGEVARFQKAKIEDLRDYLEQNGYLDPAEPLNLEAREREVLHQVGDRVPAFEAAQTTLWLESATCP